MEMFGFRSGSRGQFASGGYLGWSDDGDGDGAGDAASAHWLLPALQGAVGYVTGGVPRPRGAPYGSDLRLYNGAGIPSLHYGPGEASTFPIPH